jgi:hypothetical protein
LVQQAKIHFEQYVGAASEPLAPKYRPRKPEKTILYRTVKEHLETMLAEACPRTEHGFGYPHFIEREFRRYLECGQLANGFARLRCKSCGYEQLLAFSCKGRLCPSCHARRMHNTAFHLVEHVLPHVPYRQWVLTLPRPVRLLMARDKMVLSQVLSILLRTLFSFQRRAAKKDGFDNVLPGSITFVQLFGSALNLNVHYHALLMDGVFVDTGPEKELVFLELMAPTQKDVEHLIRKLARRVKRYISDYCEQHALDGQDFCADIMEQTIAHALQPPQPLLPNIPTESSAALDKPHRCASFEGFSLHANVSIQAKDRAGLLRLLRYGARQSFSQKQLTELPDGRLSYTLKRPFGPAGIRQLMLEPTDLLHRLAVLIPKPYLNLTRFFGILAPNANRRWEIIPGGRRRPRGNAHPCAEEVQEPELHLAQSSPLGSRLPWSELLRRTFGDQILKCPQCVTGTLCVIAVITDRQVTQKILRHLGLESTLPVAKPARSELDELVADVVDELVAHEPTFAGQRTLPFGRAPPRA